MDLRVECKPGFAGEPEPDVVWFGARRVDVESIVDRWYDPRQRWWKVQTQDGLYVLRRNDTTGDWDLAAVARA